MKKNTVIINTARGSIINENDLILALKNSLIAGAALDVLEIEPPNSDNPLLTMKNVILTPHVAWFSEKSRVELKKRTAENVALVLQNKLPRYVANTDVLGRDKAGIVNFIK